MWDGEGVNFAVFSANAKKVELCLFDRSGNREEARIALPEYTDEVWHAYLPDARPNLLYGYRVYGPLDPANGHQFNPTKLLIDPYPKALQGRLRGGEPGLGYVLGGPARIYRSIDATIHATCRSAGSSNPPSPGARIVGLKPHGKKQSSSNCMCEVSPSNTRMSSLRTAVPSPAWFRRLLSITWLVSV